MPLKELKLREFRDRKKLLNPYQKEQLLATSSNSDELLKLAEKVSVKTMYSFNITYDRHKERYGYRTSNFPSEYHPNESSLNYANDPDWILKMGVRRISLKKWMFIFIIGGIWLYRRI